MFACSELDVILRSEPRTTIKGEARYYIREIPNLYVVGQTYPVTEVPGPHSRKITNTIKLRLQIIAFKLLEKSTEKRLKISRLMKYFPDQNELQMRQRLKVCVNIRLRHHTRCSLRMNTRNLWSIIVEDRTKASGASRAIGRSHPTPTCSRW